MKQVGSRQNTVTSQSVMRWFVEGDAGMLAETVMFVVAVTLFYDVGCAGSVMD